MFLSNSVKIDKNPNDGVGSRGGTKLGILVLICLVLPIANKIQIEILAHNRLRFEIFNPHSTTADTNLFWFGKIQIVA